LKVQTLPFSCPLSVTTLNMKARLFQSEHEFAWYCLEWMPDCLDSVSVFLVLVCVYVCVCVFMPRSTCYPNLCGLLLTTHHRNLTNSLTLKLFLYYYDAFMNWRNVSGDFLKQKRSYRVMYGTDVVQWYIQLNLVLGYVVIIKASSSTYRWLWI
jgi:hypothetical protein